MLGLFFLMELEAAYISGYDGVEVAVELKNMGDI